MKKNFLLSLLASAAFSLPAAAAVVQTTGAGSATPSAQHLTYSANFEANTSTASTWSEGGLLFSQVNAADGHNNGCGYAGTDCGYDPSIGDVFSQAFSDNYFAAAGLNAYLSIKSEGASLNGIEFAVDTGIGNIVYVMWQTWLNGLQTGTGKAAMGTAGIGGVLGLSDVLGFSEVRVYAFNSAAANSGMSAPAIDSVVAFTVPEPGSLALAALAGLCAAGLRRRRG